MAVTSYQTQFKRVKQGVCSTWLAKQGDDLVPVWFSKGTMKIPQEPRPLIMVGPGTGIAAFRSFIQYCRMETPERTLVLIFGCRSESKDFYYA